MARYIARYQSPPGVTAKLQTSEEEYMNSWGGWMARKPEITGAPRVTSILASMNSAAIP